MTNVTVLPTKLFTRLGFVDIPGYAGRYQVDRYGRVLSLGNKKRPHGRFLKLQRTAQGYNVVTLYRGVPGRTSGKKFKVAVLVLLTFVGPRPVGRRNSCHKDGNRMNDRSSNLYWGSYQQNAKDALRHGTVSRGEGRANAKLTEQQVVSIRKRARRETVRELARDYGVSPSLISGVISGYRWGHVCTV